MKIVLVILNTALSLIVGGFLLFYLYFFIESEQPTIRTGDLLGISLYCGGIFLLFISVVAGWVSTFRPSVPKVIKALSFASVPVFLVLMYILYSATFAPVIYTPSQIQAIQ